jgi:NTP pyrophosphatase (non-canonical NTP hydrolase)
MKSPHRKDAATAKQSNARARTSTDSIEPSIPDRIQAAKPKVLTGMKEYQVLANLTSEFKLRGPLGQVAPMLGLAGETGAILDAHKRYLRTNLDWRTNRERIREELGDLLWYIAAVATSVNLDLGDVAQHNLERTRDIYPGEPMEKLLAQVPVLDVGALTTERFPRKLAIYFSEKTDAFGSDEAELVLHSAEPNAFRNGPLQLKGKRQGFLVGEALGDPLTDNSRRKDGYRYHDALHLGFMAVIGWSPVMRYLLALRRRSNKETERDEDGPRAQFAEEGLAAVLSRLAPKRMGFLDEQSIDGYVIDIAKAAAADTEAAAMPGWLWRRAICEGFKAMDALNSNRGGCILADLDARKLVYSKDPT